MPLKELQWLTPFDEESRATSSARTSKGAGAYGTRIRCNSIWSVIVPADGTRTATVGNGDVGTSAFCWAALGQAAACQYLFMWGIRSKEQWRVEKLRTDLSR
jgi:hypothetical protein